MIQVHSLLLERLLLHFQLLFVQNLGLAQRGNVGALGLDPSELLVDLAVLGLQLLVLYLLARETGMLDRFLAKLQVLVAHAVRAVHYS